MEKVLNLYKDTEGDMRQVVEVKGHKLYFDVPELLGGSSSAPDPHDYFDASIVACKALTIKIYANRKKYDLQDMKVTATRDDSGERKGLYKLKVSIELIGDLSEAERQDLLAAAEKCPVGKLVTDDVQVDITSELI